MLGYLQRGHALDGQFGRRSGREQWAGCHPWRYQWRGILPSPLNKTYSKHYCSQNKLCIGRPNVLMFIQSNIPANVWTMPSLPVPKTLYTSLFGKLLKSCIYKFRYHCSNTGFNWKGTNSSFISICWQKNTARAIAFKNSKLLFTFQIHYRECNSDCDALFGYKTEQVYYKFNIIVNKRQI